MSKALTISGSIFLGALSLGVLEYVSNQGSLWQLPSRIWQDEQHAKQSSQPVKVGLSKINTEGTIIGTKDTSFRISNPSDKHVAICLHSVIVSRNNTDDKFSAPTYCFSDIPPFTTTTQSVPNQDFNNRIGEICYDQVRYDQDLRNNEDAYNQQLSQWQAKVDSYAQKIPSDPLYAKAIQILNAKKPKPLPLPTKVFGWNFCELHIEDIK